MRHCNRIEKYLLLKWQQLQRVFFLTIAIILPHSFLDNFCYIYKFTNRVGLNGLELYTLRYTKWNFFYYRKYNWRFDQWKCMAQLAGDAEYTDCISAEGWDSPNECPGYDTKQSDGETPVMLEFWGNVESPFIAIDPRSTLTSEWYYLRESYLWVK